MRQEQPSRYVRIKVDPATGAVRLSVAFIGRETHPAAKRVSLAVSGSAAGMSGGGHRSAGMATLRRLLVHGARTVLRWRRAKPGTGPGWTDRLLERRPTNVVLVAMANKTARVAWALLRYERIYEPMSA